jgi:hypothetical protein
MLRSHHPRFYKNIYKRVVCSGVLYVTARAGGMPGGGGVWRVGVDDQWHSGWSLLLCSVARCLGVGACSQAEYPGIFGCMRGFVVSSRGCGFLFCVCGPYAVLVSNRVDGWSHMHPCASPQLCCVLTSTYPPLLLRTQRGCLNSRFI